LSTNFKNQRLIRDGSGTPIPQYWCVNEEVFKPLDEAFFAKINSYSKHNHLTGSEGVQGWLTTQAVDQVIVPVEPLNALYISVKENGLEILLNDDTTPWYVDGSGDPNIITGEGIEDMTITHFKIVGAIGQIYKWRGLYYKEE